MKIVIKYLLVLCTVLTVVSCGVYGFSGVNTGNAKTVQINFFPNQAPIIEPTLSQRFTQDFQDLFTRQTNLTLVNNGGELLFEGEIVDYRITPMSATANQTAAQNRLTIVVNVRFTNNLKEKDSFEKQFSFYYDYGASQQLVAGLLDTALEEIITRITQDIFNASVANW